MNRLLLFLPFGNFSSLSLGYDVSHFYVCSTDYVKKERNFLCQVSKFNMNVPLPSKADEFFDCCMETSEWMSRGSKALLVDQLFKDMKKYGFNSVADRGIIEEVGSNCRKEMGSKINGRGYILCFLADRRTSKCFKNMLKKKEGEFFTKQTYCKSG
uniref:Short form D7 salivary protein SD7-1 n=1 Tax=Aedes albopictus TaxID=7160 RepID=Q5MIX1_AEDAL|nr:short form D7 salivary protein SD7-1 [Aedes albopictus]